MPILPPGLSTLAAETDRLLLLFLTHGVVVATCLFTTLVVLLYRYRRQSRFVRGQPVRSQALVALELVWIALLVVPTFFLFRWDAQASRVRSATPSDAYLVRVRARQWAWEFEHPNGIIEDNTLHVPVGRAVQLVLSSSDVIHSSTHPSSEQEVTSFRV